MFLNYISVPVTRIKEIDAFEIDDTVINSSHN